MNHHTTQSSALASHEADHEASQEHLTQSSLEDFFPKLTDDPCERFSSLFDFYVQGRCELAIQAELDQHRASCDRCSALYVQRSEWRNSLIKGVEDMRPTITIDDAEASLKNLLESRWDELELDDLALDDLRDVLIEGAVEGEIDQGGMDDQGGEVDEQKRTEDTAEDTAEDRGHHRSTIQLLDECEPSSRRDKRRVKRRVISLICTVSAAAFLFAYGPAFIEINVTESEPEFPTALSPESPQPSTQRATSHAASHQERELPRWTPLINHIGARLPLQEPIAGGQVSLVSCVTSSLDGEEHTSSQLHYTLSLSGSPTRVIEVELSSQSLTSAQSAQLKQRSLRATGTAHQESAKVSSIKEYQSETLRLIEYIDGGRHYQWSAQLSAPAELLSSLVELHRSH